jgi:hypothetical protein
MRLPDGLPLRRHREAEVDRVGKDVLRRELQRQRLGEAQAGGTIRTRGKEGRISSALRLRTDIL